MTNRLRSICIQKNGNLRLHDGLDVSTGLTIDLDVKRHAMYKSHAMA